MQQALLIRLRPLGPWRYGPDDGGHDRLDTLYRSDRLFSAVTLAMRRLGWLDAWLDATARAAQPAVTFSSLYPFQGETLFTIPPATIWPPPANLVTTSSPVFLAKLRWNIARFVPLPVIDSLLTGQNILADQWLPDPESGCLLRRDRPSSSPFRVVARGGAAVDRLEGVSHHAASLACVEFEANAGLWMLACFGNSEAEATWSDRVQAALRLLADSGFGARRSAGWGKTQTPEFQRGLWPNILFPKTGRSSRTGIQTNGNGATALYWLLSLYWPASFDQVDWAGGDYQLTVRSGRVDNSAATGAVKKAVRMVGEGSVIAAAVEPAGAAVDVAPEGFAHAVYRSGFAVALRLPAIAAEPEFEAQIEPPATEEALESLATEEVGAPRPCAEPEAHIEEQPPTAESESAEAGEAETTQQEPATTVSEIEPEGPAAAIEEPAAAPVTEEPPDEVEQESPENVEQSETAPPETEADHADRGGTEEPDHEL
jgi:CRISPR type III-A-associated RAMP protein Csm4